MLLVPILNSKILPVVVCFQPVQPTAKSQTVFKIGVINSQPKTETRFEDELERRNDIGGSECRQMVSIFI